MFCWDSFLFVGVLVSLVEVLGRYGEVGFRGTRIGFLRFVFFSLWFRASCRALFKTSAALALN